jgi:hypothetical protein
VKILYSRTSWAASASLLAVILAVAAVRQVAAQKQEKTAAPAASQGDNKAMTVQTGFYCNLNALTPEERVSHHLLTQKLAAARVETTELSNGYAFRMQSGAVSLADLATWISWESKCCPFFDFEIELQRDGGPLWLKLRASEGGKTFMQHEFKIQ